MEFKDKVNLFMYAFMYDIENKLKENSPSLREINFYADEANVDIELKKFIKEFIKESFSNIPMEKKNYQLSLVLNKGKEVKKTSFSYSNFISLYINEVYLPTELTEEIKELVKKNEKVFVYPDLLLEIREHGTDNITYTPIELKSTKENNIPGSSVQQVTPNEWVIFVKHTNADISITIGQYINSINHKMQFPDRSPRPQISFKILSNHNNLNRHEKEKELIYNIDEESIKNRYELLKDWQGILVNKWLKIIKSNKVKKREPWFNNTIRRYTLNFLSFYEKLSDINKVKLKNNITNAINSYNTNKNCND